MAEAFQTARLRQWVMAKAGNATSVSGNMTVCLTLLALRPAVILVPHALIRA